MWSSSTGIIEVQGQKDVKEKTCNMFRKNSYLCEVQALEVQEHFCKKFLSVTLLGSPTPTC